MNDAPDPTLRFSDRVEDYARYRPRYPDSVLRALETEARLGAATIVADIGSGTGIFAELLLRAGCTVHAIEPNREMREAAERALSDCPNFHSVEGTAEATQLPDASVELVTAAQAFHWFDPRAARAEFARILKPRGKVALVWNSRQTRATPFLRAYEQLLQTFGTDYRQVDHLNITAEQLDSFYRSPFRRLAFPNEQSLDLEGLRGRLLSSSYTPAEGHPQRKPMLAELARIFQEHQEGGTVRVLYETELFLGQLPV